LIRSCFATFVLALGLCSAATFAQSNPTFDVHLLAIDTNEGCDVGDINKDGVMDIVAGRLWFAGPDYVPRPVRAIGEFGKDYTASNGEFLHDVNGDGWLDVISIGFLESQVYWFENPGKQGLAFGKLWTKHLLVDTKLEQNEAAWLRDMDGDGEVEFIVNSWNKKNPMVYWDLTKNDKGEPTAKRITIGPSNGHGQGYGDINGDGREDLVFSGGWYERPAGDAPGEWKLHTDFELPHASCPMIVTDVDGDGRTDILWGHGHGFGLFFLQQLAPSTDGKTQWKQHTIDKEWSQAHALHWVDLDGDGKHELITGKRVRGHSGKDPGADQAPAMYGYRWQPDSNSFKKFTIAEGVGTGLQIRTADMNADGKLDIVVPGKDGTHVLIQK